MFSIDNIIYIYYRHLNNAGAAHRWLRHCRVPEHGIEHPSLRSSESINKTYHITYSNWVHINHTLSHRMIHLINRITIATSARPKRVLLSPQSSGVLGTCWNAPSAWPKDSAHTCARAFAQIPHYARWLVCSRHWRHCDQVFVCVCALGVFIAHVHTCVLSWCEVKDPVICTAGAPCAIYDSIITTTYTSYKYATKRRASERDATEQTHTHTRVHTHTQKHFATK